MRRLLLWLSIPLFVFAAIVAATLRDVSALSVAGAWALGLGMCVGVIYLHGVCINAVLTRRTITVGAGEDGVWKTVFLLLLAHLLEMELFGTALFAADWMGLGTITGATDASFADYLYFSFTTYTSLGLGDVSPTDSMRLLAGLETLTGLICIGWTTAVLFGVASKQGNPSD